MCVDLKNYQSVSSRPNVLLLIAATVLAIALLGWCLKLLPAAIDQAFNCSMETSGVVSGAASSQKMESFSMRGQGEFFYHPSTHQWTFVED